MQNSTFLTELRWRGLIKDITPYTETQMDDDSGMITGYIGFDPTAKSLHVGNLCAIMLLKHLQLAGHKPIILLGGFTGSIGDPAGKINERKILVNDVIEENLNALRKQFAKYLDFKCGANSAEFVDNKDWLQDLSLPDFLSYIGRYISVNYMLAKDSVKARLENGLSFTEFTYQLFQAYDFYWLYEHKNCKLQMGGSDQWGNITGGIELIRKRTSKDALALTTGLLTKSDGGKFGKSEEGNVWLDPELTSPFKFYQFWLNVEDEQIGRLLRIFTLRSEEEIIGLEKEHATNPNALKRILANDITTTVHSAEICVKVEHASKLLFSDSSLEDFEMTDEAILKDIFSGLPFFKLSYDDVQSLKVDALIANLYQISKGESKRLIYNKGININMNKIDDPTTPVIGFRLLKGKFLLLKKGISYGICELI